MKLRSSWPEVASTMRLIRGKGVFQAGSVDVDKINSELPFSICFFDENYVSQQVGVIHLPDSSGLEEFANLFVDCFLPL